MALAGAWRGCLAAGGTQRGELSADLCGGGVQQSVRWQKRSLVLWWFVVVFVFGFTKVLLLVARLVVFRGVLRVAGGRCLCRAVGRGVLACTDNVFKAVVVQLRSENVWV